MIKSFASIGLFWILSQSASAQISFVFEWEQDGHAFLPGQELCFQGTEYSGGPLQFFWDFGDGASSQGQTVKHSYVEAGHYRVAVYATNDEGFRSDTVYSWLFINTGEVPAEQWEGHISGQISTPSFPLVAAAGTTIHFEGSSEVTDASFFWWIDLSEFNAEGTSWDWAIPTDWDDVHTEVDAIAIHPDGTVSRYPDEGLIYIYGSHQPPDTSIADPEPDGDGIFRINLGETLVLTASGEASAEFLPLSFEWQLQARGALSDGFCTDYDAGGPPVRGDTFSFTPEQDGIYCLNVAAIDTEDVEDPFAHDFQVIVRSENRAPEGRITTLSQVIQVGESASWVAEGSDADNDLISYQWNLGDGRSAQGETAEATYTSTGVYRIELTTNDGVSNDPTPFARWLFVNDPLENPINNPPEPSLHRPSFGQALAQEEAVVFTGFIHDADMEETTAYWDLGDGSLASGPGSVLEDGNPVELQVEHTYAAAGQYQAQLFARDAAGLTVSEGDGTSFVVYADVPPPQGHIVTPQLSETGERRLEIKAGTCVSFAATIEVNDNPENYRVEWQFLSPGFKLDGLKPEPYCFEEPLVTYVQLDVAHNETGEQDPFSDSFLLIVQDNLSPTGSIVEPKNEAIIDTAGNISLAASGSDPDGDPLSYAWLLSDGRAFEGQRVDYVTFPQSGVYQIELTISDDKGASYKPDFRAFVAVNDIALEGNSPPSISRISPMQTVSGPPGSSFHFQVEASDPAGESIDVYYWDFGDGRGATVAEPGSIAYESTGEYYVRAYARDASGLWSPYPVDWRVVIHGSNIPPEASIVSPALRERDDYYQAHTYPVLISDTVLLSGTASDRDGHYPLNLTWSRDYEDFSSEPELSLGDFEQIGPIRIDLAARDNAGEVDATPDFRIIKVVDPTLELQSYIATPDMELTVVPGQPVNFFGYGEDPNDLEMTLEWNFGEGAVPSTASGDEVKGVVFSEGTHRVEMTVTTQFERQDPSPATVTIIARNFSDSDFEPNNSLSEAAQLGRGSYEGLSLDEADNSDVFRFDLSEEERDFSIAIDAEQDLVLELFRLEDEVWVAYEDAKTLRRDTLTFEDLTPGSYGLQVTAAELARLKTGLSFSLSVNTLQPSLYLPFLVEDGNLTSSFGIINPTNATVDIVVVGLDGAGATVETKSFQMKPHERRYQAATDFFGRTDQVAKARIIRWLEIRSTHRIAGYLNAETVDASQLMSAGATRALADEVFVPHIAADTATWFTRAVLVNGGQQAHALNFDFLGQTTAVAELNSSSQEDFRFGELFSELPGWGRFSNPNGGATISGIEIFGKADNTQQIAAIEMLPGFRNNSNFTSSGNDIYFTHVATDEGSFWTGIVLGNSQNFPLGFNLIGYEVDGTEHRMDDLVLEAGGKYVRTSTQLFGANSGVAWIKVEAEPGMFGIELFGGQGNERLAGFPAADFATDELIFPHVVSGDWYTGIAMLNLVDEQVTVTLSAYNDEGTLLAQAETTIAANSKLVRPPALLFPDQSLPASTSYIVATANKKALNGFEIFGDFADKRLGGLSALTK